MNIERSIKKDIRVILTICNVINPNKIMKKLLQQFRKTIAIIFLYKVDLYTAQFKC